MFHHTDAGATSLLAHVSALDYEKRVGTLVRQIPSAATPSAALDLLRKATHTLGAESAVFFSFVRDHQDLATFRIMLACDPNLLREHLEGQTIANDPWLRYASGHTEPLLNGATGTPDADDSRRGGLASSAGFASALLIPAHSAPGRSRVSLLCLGSPVPGYFDDEGIHALRFAARALALELHEWWLARMRRELAVKARLTPDDLALLEQQRQGRGSKQIADVMRVSISSINSRFQRLNLKLGVGNRRQAAQLAEECGLIGDGGQVSPGIAAGIQSAMAQSRSAGPNDRTARG